MKLVDFVKLYLLVFLAGDCHVWCSKDFLGFFMITVCPHAQHLLTIDASSVVQRYDFGSVRNPVFVRAIETPDRWRSERKPSFKLRPEAAQVGYIDEQQAACTEVDKVDILEHAIEIVLLLKGTWLVATFLWQARIAAEQRREASQQPQNGREE